MTDPTIYRHPVRVYYEDTDAGGIVYYANYFRFAERARTEILRQYGIEHTALLAEERVAFAVKETHADYIKPARLDDALVVETQVNEVGGASVRMTQNICRDGEVVVSITVRLACMNVDTGGPARLPGKVRNYLSGAESARRTG